MRKCLQVVSQLALFILQSLQCYVWEGYVGLFRLFQRQTKPRFAAVSDVSDDIVANTGKITAAMMRLSADIATKLAHHLPTEQDIWWFLVEQYDHCTDLGEFHQKLLQMSSLGMHPIEFEGRRSENSYVGKPNPGIAFLRKQRREVSADLTEDFAEIVITQAFVFFIIQNEDGLNALRTKYATHFHNNCVKTAAYNNAERWADVIDDLESR